MPELDFEAIDEDAVLKEVWNIEDIEAKSELYDNQIIMINKLKTLSKIFNSSILDKHLTDFMILQKSRSRKSMEEFVNVVKAKREDFVNKGKSWFGSLMG